MIQGVPALSWVVFAVIWSAQVAAILREHEAKTDDLARKHGVQVKGQVRRPWNRHSSTAATCRNGRLQPRYELCRIEPLPVQK